MNKIIYLFLLLGMPLIAGAQKTDPSPYCVSEYNNNYNMVKEIAIGSFTHSFGAVGSTASPNNYLYIDTAHIPPISMSLNTNIFLDFYGVSDTAPAYFAVWIDYDQNKIFDDTTELIYHNENTIKTKLPVGSNVSLPLLVKAPLTSKLGITRMRITRAENTADPKGPYSSTFRLKPCATKTASGTAYGCTYDFDVKVLGLSDIDEQTLKTRLNIYPNPASKFISVENASGQSVKNVSVLDLSGKQVLATSETGQVDISNLSGGFYWVNILLENGQKETRKLIKQ